MKLKYDFAVREIAGEYVLIPMGAAALQFSGMVTTNEVGAFLCEALKQETTREQLLSSLCREFETDEATAGADLDAFLAMLRRADILGE